jgi:hypothetical protein
MLWSPSDLREDARGEMPLDPYRGGEATTHWRGHHGACSGGVIFFFVKNRDRAGERLYGARCGQSPLLSGVTQAGSVRTDGRLNRSITEHTYMLMCDRQFLSNLWRFS